MTHWHRLIFDPRPGRSNFASSEEFTAWCAEPLADFEYRTAGFIIPNWADTVTSFGVKLWNVIIPGQTSYATGETTVLGFLANTQWAIDDFDVLLYIKAAPGENEILFPVRAGGNSHA